MRGLIMLVGVLAIIAIAGCGKKESPSSQNTEQKAPSGQTATHEVATTAHAENEQVNTSGSTADIIARVHEQEHELDQIIASAQLTDVHKKAFAIRDLLTAAVDRADPSKKAALQPHIDAVKATASELDEAGDSGDLAKTKSNYETLKMHVKAIEDALGVSSR